MTGPTNVNSEGGDYVPGAACAERTRRKEPAPSAESTGHDLDQAGGDIDNVQWNGQPASLHSPFLYVPPYLYRTVQMSAREPPAPALAVTVTATHIQDAN
ncbi:hypothetical protein VE03_07910 [Pseudogymnoascus sp. 23342-1-I1]|nr:hypothetical protein VE03_07910 [Pseudogymnoascus sp. 23342-1-I1]